MDQSTSRLLELGFARASARGDADALYRPVISDLVQDREFLLDTADQYLDEVESSRTEIYEKTKEVESARSLFIGMSNTHRALVDEYKTLDQYTSDLERTRIHELSTQKNETIPYYRSLEGVNDYLFDSLVEAQDDYKDSKIFADIEGKRAILEQRRADKILTTANDNTWKYNSERKRGGTYGIMNHETGLFNVTEWKHTIDQLTETNDADEIERKLTTGNPLTSDKEIARGSRLPPSQSLSDSTWFAPSQPYNFDKAYTISRAKEREREEAIRSGRPVPDGYDGISEYEHAKYGRLRGINFGAKSLLQIPKITEDA